MALRADDVDLGRDRALVVRFQSGEDGAFDDLYRRYFARLRRFCERRVGDPHEAEELAQEAFVRALRAMPDFAGERRFYPWMTVIASRLCVDSHRRRQRSTPVAEVDLGSVEADLEPLFAEVDRAHLSEALNRLAPRHREVLELRERDGWTYQRIAEHYDVTLGTVEALLHRARRALRREFDKVTSGERVAVLAGVPGAAWVLRRLDALRLKAAHLADYASPLSAAVASVAIAAGSIAVVDSGAAPDGPPSRPAATVVSVGTRELTSAVTAPHAADALGVLPTADDGASRGTATAAAPPARTPARLAPQVAVGDADRGRAATAEAPVRQEVAGLGGIGVDPGAVLTDTVERVITIIGGAP